MQDVDPPPSQAIFPSTNIDPEEARLEAHEFSRYLLAKSYFDCREYDRCAAVFLPSALPRAPPSPVSPSSNPKIPGKGSKGKDTEFNRHGPGSSSNSLPRLSQKALFLALYARYMSGEKRKDEDGEMILGPADGGTTVNKELVGIASSLQGWFADRAAKGVEGSNQGWLEYLYGVVLAKGKTELEAKRWLLRSVHLCPINWGAWLELNDLLNNVEEVGRCFEISILILLTLVEAPETCPGATAAYNHSSLPHLRQPRALPIIRSGS